MIQNHQLQGKIKRLVGSPSNYFLIKDQSIINARIESLERKGEQYELPKINTGGQGGIRTHGMVTHTLVFKTRSIDHSDTYPTLLLSYNDNKLKNNLQNNENILHSSSDQLISRLDLMILYCQQSSFSHHYTHIVRHDVPNPIYDVMIFHQCVGTR